MERVHHQCAEIHVYAGDAERTGVLIELQGLKAHRRACSSIRDLIRKYKLLGDGIFYLPVDQWPADASTITLSAKWMGIDGASR
jgi:hypothetical protein